MKRTAEETKRFTLVVSKIGKLKRELIYEIDSLDNPEKTEARKAQQRDLDYLIAERNQMLA